MKAARWPCVKAWYKGSEANKNNGKNRTTMKRRPALDLSTSTRLHKRTALELLDCLTVKSLRKTVINRYMNKMIGREKRELRRIVGERFQFYRKLRRLTGLYRNTAKQDKTRIKRMDRLPFSIDHGDSSCWRFVDATRGVLLEGGRLLIPSIQRASTGRLYLDIRIWTYNDDDEQTTVTPTRKGACIPLGKLTELRDRLTALDVRCRREEKRAKRGTAWGNGSGSKVQFKP